MIPQEMTQHSIPKKFHKHERIFILQKQLTIIAEGCCLQVPSSWPQKRQYSFFKPPSQSSWQLRDFPEGLQIRFSHIIHAVENEEEFKAFEKTPFFLKTTITLVLLSDKTFFFPSRELYILLWQEFIHDFLFEEIPAQPTSLSFCILAKHYIAQAKSLPLSFIQKNSWKEQVVELQKNKKLNPLHLTLFSDKQLLTQKNRNQRHFSVNLRSNASLLWGIGHEQEHVLLTYQQWSSIFENFPLDL